MSTMTQEGYLVIADISGYTSYVASTELEHAQAVLTELLELLVRNFQPLLKLAKLEGDAVFAHAPEKLIARGENILELIESTYLAFRGRRDGIVRHTTCECRACKAIPTLDLKFIVHYGKYIIQNVSGISELVGSDVNLLHRLTKNHVSEATGWLAYALFTETCFERMGLGIDGLHEQVENYQHLGEVRTFNLDLHKRHDEIIERRRLFIRSDDADATLTIDLAVPPAIAWEWITNPQKRNLYSGKSRWSAVVRPGGRTGVGASNHCDHGKDAVSVETIIDWRPFDYFTIDSRGRNDRDTNLDAFFTYHLEKGPDGRTTRLHMNVKLKKYRLYPKIWFRIAARMMKLIYRNMEKLALEEMVDFDMEFTDLSLAAGITPELAGE